MYSQHDDVILEGKEISDRSLNGDVAINHVLGTTLGVSQSVRQSLQHRDDVWLSFYQSRGDFSTSSGERIAIAVGIEAVSVVTLS